jgi:hypothetical protein
VTEKRERISTDPGLGPLDLPDPSTLRSIEAAEDVSSISPNAPVYYEPAPLIAVSDHKTLELETVKLAENIDPRRLATEMSLGRVSSSLFPPSDSGWPPETALTSSSPPDAPSRRRRAPLVLFVLLGVLLVLLVVQVTTRRSTSRVDAPVTTAAAVAAPPQPASAAVSALPAPILTPAVTVADSPATTAAAPQASAEPHSEGPRATSNANVRRHSAKPNSQPAALEQLTAPSSSKPKRAIY